MATFPSRSTYPQLPRRRLVLSDRDADRIVSRFEWEQRGRRLINVLLLVALVTGAGFAVLVLEPSFRPEAELLLTDTPAEPILHLVRHD